MEIIEFIIVILVVIMILGYQNMIIQRYTIVSEKIHHSVKIALITDLHGAVYGKHQVELVQTIKNEQPDLIFIVGDFIDKYCRIEDVADLLKGISNIPCYYVLGNHESQVDLSFVKKYMSHYGVHFIGQRVKQMTMKGTVLTIAGIDDPMTFASSIIIDEDFKQWKKALHQLNEKIDQKSYTILLSHRPSFVEEYQKTNFDLIVSGHAHGGQWRIPGLLNGLIAPDEGLFPCYAGGQYDLDNRHFIVSRGLAKNLIPRVFNPPELVMIDLVPDKT